MYPLLSRSPSTRPVRPSSPHSMLYTYSARHYISQPFNLNSYLHCDLQALESIMILSPDANRVNSGILDVLQKEFECGVGRRRKVVGRVPFPTVLELGFLRRIRGAVDAISRCSMSTTSSNSRSCLIPNLILFLQVTLRTTSIHSQLSILIQLEVVHIISYIHIHKHSQRSSESPQKPKRTVFKKEVFEES